MTKVAEIPRYFTHKMQLFMDSEGISELWNLELEFLWHVGYRLLIIKESQSPLKITRESKVSSFITLSLSDI